MIIIMLLMKTDAEVSVPEVSSLFCTFSMMETTDVMLEIVDFRAVTAASCRNTMVSLASSFSSFVEPFQRQRMAR